jgi:hypothetical protein
MHKNATKCNKTQSKWCKNKHGASKIIDMFETYQRPFLNTAGAVIDCNQGKVTFKVNDKEHIVYFPKKIARKYAFNSIRNIETIKVGQIICSRPKPKEEYQIFMVGTMPIKVKVT